MEELGFEVTLDLDYDQALEKVAAALKAEGFGILTRIDVRATMKEKLGEEFRPYAILGACNPPLAHKALSTDAWVGLMLPCNVTVEAAEQGGSIVRIVNPRMMMAVGNLGRHPAMLETAETAYVKLHRVAEALK